MSRDWFVEEGKMSRVWQRLSRFGAERYAARRRVTRTEADAAELIVRAEVPRTILGVKDAGVQQSGIPHHLRHDAPATEMVRRRVGDPMTW